jgi:tyrosyl-tRNA synthetase
VAISKGKKFLQEFKERQLFYQCTAEEELVIKIDSGERFAAYIGFDCTATSLHVGSLIQLMTFRLFQKYGIQPLVIIGGGTSKIGDPSFKDSARKMLDDKTIAENMRGIKNSIAKFIEFGSGHEQAIMLNNDDWLSNLQYIDFLRDVGKHFSVNKMLHRGQNNGIGY